MIKTRMLAAVALAALGLTACNRNGDIGTGAGMGGGGSGDHRICTPFANVSANTNAAGAPTPLAAPADAASGVDDCVHRWSYTLAGGRDTADVVARGVVAACSAALSTWNQGSMGQAGVGPNGQDGGGEAISMVTGAPVSPMGAHMEFAQQRALFYVVQARAGHCSPPPVQNNTNARNG